MVSNSQGNNLKSLYQPKSPFKCTFWKATLHWSQLIIHIKFFFFFFFLEFQPMASALNDSFLILDQDTNQFLV